LDLPLIDATFDSSPAPLPQLVTLEGRLVNVMPLDPLAHAASLYAGTHGEDRDAIWRFMADGPFPNLAGFESSLRIKAASQDPLFYTILDRATGAAAGYASYMRIKPAHRVIEVGSIVFTRALQKTAGATEAMYLMARYAFEQLGYRRYEWKCNALHSGSMRAAARLGFRFEGIFRQHMIIKGLNRDTAWFAMLDHEWPARKANLERWLNASNFDAAGKQVVSLSALNGVVNP
jgi:RimJ/RimL family protein N-acetyltransferase